eukprot:m51a1_g3369 putative u3 small nucleolar ribonucleoprotein protein imp4-like (293) ;mRNA; f:456994-458033
MIRRVTRLRREYLYRKSLEGKERERYEKKRLIRKALAEGKPVPSELRDERAELELEIMHEDQTTAGPPPDVSFDSEYARAGIQDPKIFITTSRDPSSRLIQFAKELRLLVPNAQKLNRGKHMIPELVDACRTNEASDLIIVHEHRGQPDGLIVTHLPFGPTIYFGLFNCVLRHDVEEKKTIPQAYPHLVFHGFDTKLGSRVMATLKYLFPVPKEDSKRVVTFANQGDFISVRHHVYKRAEGGKSKAIELEELGPRFELRPYQIRLGTLENDAAENEWSLTPYVNSAKRRRLL